MPIEIINVPIITTPTVIDNVGTTGDYTFGLIPRDADYLKVFGLDVYRGVIAPPPYLPDGETFVSSLAKDNFTFTPNLTSNIPFVTSLAKQTDFNTTLAKDSSFINQLTATSFTPAVGSRVRLLTTNTTWLSGFLTSLRFNNIETLFNKSLASSIDLSRNPYNVNINKQTSDILLYINPFRQGLNFYNITDPVLPLSSLPEDVLNLPFSASTLYSNVFSANSSFGLHNFFFNNSSFIVNLSANLIKVDNISVNSLSTIFLQANEGNILALSSSFINVLDLSSTNLTSTKGLFNTISSSFIESLVNIFADVTATNLSAFSAIIDNLTANNLISFNISAKDLTAENILTSILSATSANFNNFSSLSGVVDSLSSSNLKVDSVTSNNLEINSNLLSRGLLSATNIIVDNLTATNSFLLEVSANNLQSNSLTSNVISSNQITSDNLHINTTLTVGNKITADGSIGDVYARRFYGEIIGPSVSIGQSADLISLSAQTGIINILESDSITVKTANITTANINQGNIKELTSSNIFTNTLSTTDITSITVTSNTGNFVTISAQNIFLEDLSATNIFTDNILTEYIYSDAADFVDSSIVNLTGVNAQLDNLTIIGSDDKVRLTVIQQSLQDVARFYYNDSCEVGETSAIALVIKGNGCHTSDPDQYRGGYVGIRTSEPNEALTVRGNISADNIFAGGNIRSDSIESVVAAFTSLNVLGDTNLNNVVASEITTNTLTVNGDIISTGTITGKISSTEQLNFDNTIINHLTATSISAKFIETENGNSDLWNTAYFAPVAINLVLNGGGSSIKHGAKGYVEIPYNININSWSMFADIPSPVSAVMYILSSSYESYPDTVPIFSNAPALDVGDVKNSSLNLSGWITQLSAGTVLHFGLSGIVIPGGYAEIDASLLTLSLKGTKY